MATTEYGRWLRRKADAACTRHLDRGRSAQLPRPPTAEVEVTSWVPSIDNSRIAKDHWTPLYENRWEWFDEHINVKEARGILQGLRRLCRSFKYHHSRSFFLSRITWSLFVALNVGVEKVTLSMLSVAAVPPIAGAATSKIVKLFAF